MTHTRELPQWFDDAKLGIFVHWYPASVPAFAPLSDDVFTMADQFGWNVAMRQTPYAEWYWNSLALGDTPVAAHHQDVYGDMPYEDFVPMWAEAVKDWDPSDWVNLFQRSGAQYVVAGTKHHDGVLLWPSDTPNPHRDDWNAGRDLIGPLIDSLRKVGMRIGLYYSGGLDWTFAGAGEPNNPHGIGSFSEMIEAIPRSPEYAAYVEAHWHELIDRYQPDILWNDISHPIAGNWKDLFAYYYEQIPNGVVNDRFDLRGVMKGTSHADFTTPEYRTAPATMSRKFEVCRGIGRSFGYNAQEQEADFLSPHDLIWEFIDIVSRGGNLLLNVGPTARGEIQFAQRLRLEALGTWLATNGDAIFGTRPFVSDGQILNDPAVRFTQSLDEQTVFALVRGDSTKESSRTLTIFGANMEHADTVRLLGQSTTSALPWQPIARDGSSGFSVTLPCPQPAGPAYVLAIQRRS